MELRLYTCVLLVVIAFWTRNQNFKMGAADISLEVDDDNDLSWLTQSSPKKDKNVNKNQDRGNFELLSESARKLADLSQNTQSDFDSHVFNFSMEM